MLQTPRSRAYCLVLPFLLLLSFLAQGQATSSHPKAKRGIIDVRNWDFASEKIALNGDWNFYPNELLSEDGLKEKPENPMQFPAIWDKDIHYGTYELKILAPPIVQKFALEFPQIYCSYEVWVNGKKSGANGMVGNSHETTTPQWLPQAVLFNNPGDTISIVLRIANFHHDKGGIKEPIYLGTQEMILQQRAISITSNAIEFFVLITIGLSFLVIYYVREERKKIILYFALLCVSWALRSVFSNLYLAINYFPDFNWGMMVKIEYIMLYSTMIWAILFLSRLFPNESSKIVKYILVGLNCIFVIITIVSPPLIFTQWLSIYLAVAGILLLFGGIIVIRALINERVGVWFLVACVFLNILLFSYDIFVYEGFFSRYNAVLFSLGYIAMFILLGISLMYHLKIFKGDSSSGTLTYEDLYGKK